MGRRKSRKEEKRKDGVLEGEPEGLTCSVEEEFTSSSVYR